MLVYGPRVHSLPHWPCNSGTSFATCLVDAIAWHMGMQGHEVSTVHVESHASSTAFSYYLDLAKERAKRSYGRAARPPYLLAAVEDMPADEVCFDTAVMYFDAQVRWHNGDDPGRTCHMACPCHANVTDCFSLGSCHSNNAHASLFWVHVVQDPTETILNCYHSHMQQTEPLPHERWMLELTGKQYAQRLADQGAPPWLLGELGLQKQHNTSVWQYLHSAPEDKGLLLEYLHLSGTLWQMARMYQQAHHLNRTAMVIRQEDLSADPVGTVTKVLRAAGLSSKQEAAPVAQFAIKRCSELVKASRREIQPNASIATLLSGRAQQGEASTTVPASRSMLRPQHRGKRRMSRERMLMAREPVFEVLCRLGQLMGYTRNNACERQAESVLYA